MILSSEPQVDSKYKLTQQLPNIPKDSKLLRTEAKRGQSGKHAMCVVGIFHGHKHSSGKHAMYVVGIFHGHKNFDLLVTIARLLWHPLDELRHLPDLLTKAIYNVLSRSKIDTARERLEAHSR